MHTNSPIQRLFLLTVVLITITFSLSSCNNRSAKSYDEVLNEYHSVLSDPDSPIVIHAVTTVDESVNNGIPTTYIADIHKENDSARVHITIDRNKVHYEYRNILVLHSGTAYLNLDRVLTLLDDEELSPAISDMDYFAGKYLAIPLEDLKGTFSEDIGDLLDVWYVFNSEYSSNQSSLDYVLSNEDASRVLSDINAHIEGLANKTVPVIKDSFPEELGTALTTFYERSDLVHAAERYTAALKEHFSLFGKVVNENSDSSLKVSLVDVSSGGAGKVGVVLGRKEVCSVSVMIAKTQDKPELPQIRESDIITLDDLYEHLLREVKNMIDDNFEKCDVWDKYELGDYVLRLYRHDDAVDTEVIFSFTGNKLTKYTERYVTYDVNIHDALKRKANREGLLLAADDYEDSSGLLEVYTAEGYNIPLYARYCKTPESIVDELIAKGYIE